MDQVSGVLLAVSTAVAVAVGLGVHKWVAKAFSNQRKADIGAVVEEKIPTIVTPIVEAVVAEIVQAKLDNGSRLRTTVDELTATVGEFRSETRERLASMEIRQVNVESGLENLTTWEIPAIREALAGRDPGTEGKEPPP